ncbi:MAG: ATP-binding cassette domain-containing protein [Thermoplasmata archaeon]
MCAEKLTKRYRSLTAVDGISFTVRKGECFGILGPNGAGKTTTVKMICCVSPVTEGRLSVLGLEAAEHQSEIKSRLGVVPQENNLDPDFTCLENLLVYSTYFSIPYGVAKKRATTLLKKMGLSSKTDTNIEELSGGMKRRLVLARALINNPELLILDEPTTGLDPQARNILWEKLEQMKLMGLTSVLTTHYMEEAQRLCDRIIIMDKGRILAEGKPTELIESHLGRNLIEFFISGGQRSGEKWRGSLPEQFRHAAEAIKNEGYEVELTLTRMMVYSPHKDITLSTIKEKENILFKELEKTADISIRKPTLEDLFLKLTGRRLRE